MAEHITDIEGRIRALIGRGETSEVEFKSARGGFPGSFWESYSAFANTDGGTIVLGVVEKNNRFFFDGLTEETIIRYKKELRREQIMAFCVNPKSLFDIMQHVGLKDRENFMDVYINPMLAAGMLKMTEPDHPTSRNQMYVTAEE